MGQSIKRPATVKVFGKPVKVHWVPAGDILLRDHADDQDPGLGRSDGLTLTIAIEEGQPLENEQDSFLHEVLHHVEYAMKMDLPEEVVEKLATGLLAVIKDNPSFVTYLRRRK